jgi:hypothetical protein
MATDFITRLATIEQDYNSLKKRTNIDLDLAGWAAIMWGLEQEETEFIWDCYNVELEDVEF